MTARRSSRRADTVTISGMNPGKFTLNKYSDSPSSSGPKPKKPFRVLPSVPFDRFLDREARITGLGVPGGGDRLRGARAAVTGVSGDEGEGGSESLSVDTDDVQ